MKITEAIAKRIPRLRQPLWPDTVWIEVIYPPAGGIPRFCHVVDPAGQLQFGYTEAQVTALAAMDAIVNIGSPPDGWLAATIVIDEPAVLQGYRYPKGVKEDLLR